MAFLAHAYKVRLILSLHVIIGVFQAENMSWLDLFLTQIWQSNGD